MLDSHHSYIKLFGLTICAYYFEVISHITFIILPVVHQALIAHRLHLPVTWAKPMPWATLYPGPPRAPGPGPGSVAPIGHMGHARHVFGPCHGHMQSIRIHRQPVGSQHAITRQHILGNVGCDRVTKYIYTAYSPAIVLEKCFRGICAYGSTIWVCNEFMSRQMC